MMTEKRKFYICPQPVSVKTEKGEFVLAFDSKIVLSGNADENEYGYVKLLVAAIEKAVGIAPAILKGIEPLKGDIYINVDSKKVTEKENYTVEVTNDGICLTAGEDAGVLYAVNTLRQLFEQCGGVIPCMKIEDGPKIPNRGFFHDATRGRIQTLEGYKKLADRASFYKLNHLELYVEHTYMFRDFSEVWRDDTPLSAEDILELDAYCKKLCIELVPSLATFGHLDKVLKTKSYCELCELEDSDKERFTFGGRMEHHTLNISDPRSWEFVKKMLLEFMPLFSSDKFNLCGDETFDLGKGRSKAMADEIGTHRMYVNFVKKICEFLIENGKKPLFWGDIIVGSPELVSELPHGVTCLTWGYAENEHYHNAETMYKAGCTQYLCPGVHGWRHIINRLKPAYENISRMCKYAADYDAVGLLTTDWGDYGHLSDPAFSTPGLIYGAFGAWCGKLIDREELNRAISVCEYGDTSEEFTETVSELGENEGIAWEHLVQYMEYMTGSYKPSLQEQKDFLSRCHINEPLERTKRIEALEVKLTGLTRNLNERGRAVVYSYLLHSKGQKLFNRIAIAITSDTCDKKENTLIAGELETWFDLYKKNWRKSCKESELYRIQAVIFWYADFLRSK